MMNPDFDRLSTLESHRQILEKNLDHTKTLLETIDKTIAHIRGNKTMKLEEIFDGFTDEKQKIYEDYLVDAGVNQEVIKESRKKITEWPKERWLAHKKAADQVHDDLVAAINNHLEPSAPEVQKLIHQHYELTREFWTPNRESYIGLSQLYGSHPDFVQFYADIHPRLLPYLTEAMKIYAEKNLK